MNRNKGKSDLSNIFEFCKIVCDAIEVTTDLTNTFHELLYKAQNSNDQTMLNEDQQLKRRNEKITLISKIINLINSAIKFYYSDPIFVQEWEQRLKVICAMFNDNDDMMKILIDVKWEGHSLKMFYSISENDTKKTSNLPIRHIKKTFETTTKRHKNRSKKKNKRQ